MTAFVLLWFIWNVLAAADQRFDIYPFIFLTLMLSLQASYAAPLILLAQNRQADRDRVSLEQDRARDERNLADTEYLTREVAALRIALREVATRDFVRSELRSLLDEVEVRSVNEHRPDPRHDDRHDDRRLDERPRGGRGIRGSARDLAWGVCRRRPRMPCSPRCRRSTTPRSASPSPSSGWSSR